MIFAMVAQWRQELMQQVAMRGVQFNEFNTQSFGALSAIDELLFNTRQVVAIQRHRRAFAIMKGFRRRRYGFPAALIKRKLMTALPWRRARSFAASVPQLDTNRDRRIGTDIFKDAA